jgi:hypothetical protein
MEQSIGSNLMDSQSLRAMATLNHPLAHPPSTHTRRQGELAAHASRMCTDRVAFDVMRHMPVMGRGWATRLESLTVSSDATRS